MKTLPNCPKCNSEYTYEDGNLMVCPECSYEWNPAVESEENAEKVWAQCDQEFYKYPDDLAGLLAKFISENRQAFE